SDEQLEVSCGEENILVSDSITYSWNNYLEATLQMPFVHLPPKSKVDFHFRIKLPAAETVINIRHLQVILWERAIFRVAKINKSQSMGSPNCTTMSIVGIRERPISIQRMESGWPSNSSASDITIEKIIRFTTPNPIRSHGETSSARNCNPST